VASLAQGVAVSQTAADRVAISQAEERMRQERETFNQRQKQDRWWFRVRISMACVAMVLLPSLGLLCAWIALHHSEYSAPVGSLAAAGLVQEILGLLAAIWKLAFGSGPKALEPVTPPVTALRPSSNR
jgi:hypothetical protein